MLCGGAKRQSKQKRRLLGLKDTHPQSTLNTQNPKHQQEPATNKYEPK